MSEKHLNPETGEVLDTFEFDPQNASIQRLLKAGIPAERLREIATEDKRDIEE